MKKVFSKEKYIEDMGYKHYQQLIEGDVNWVDECDGLTKEQMNDLGYGADNDWMIEIEEVTRIEEN